ncbi:LOW QUALITY PROTEIN: hypothetical protein ACHAW6_007625 [Cyclotella cf. meneghiniana]
MLTEHNINKYYPDTAKLRKDISTKHNVRSTKPKAIPFEDPKSNQLKESTRQFLKVYNICDTVFTDQTGQFPTQLQSGNKYIMVMVEIDSSNILMEPIKNHSDAKLTHA